MSSEEALKKLKSCCALFSIFNFARSSVFCVAIPAGQLFVLHIRAATQPMDWRRAQSLEEQELHDYQKDERLRQQRQESADEAALRHIEIEEEIQRLDMEVPFTMWDWSSDDN